jgi:hypothetical protein
MLQRLKVGAAGLSELCVLSHIRKHGHVLTLCRDVGAEAAENEENRLMR